MKTFLEPRIKFLWQGQVEKLDRISDIVLAEDMRSKKQVRELFAEAFVEVHTIGDASLTGPFLPDAMRPLHNHAKSAFLECI